MHRSPAIHDHSFPMHAGQLLFSHYFHFFLSLATSSLQGHTKETKHSKLRKSTQTGLLKWEALSADAPTEQHIRIVIKFNRARPHNRRRKYYLPFPFSSVNTEKITKIVSQYSQHLHKCAVKIKIWIPDTKPFGPNPTINQTFTTQMRIPIRRR